MRSYWCTQTSRCADMVMKGLQWPLHCAVVSRYQCTVTLWLPGGHTSMGCGRNPVRHEGGPQWL